MLVLCVQCVALNLFYFSFPLTPRPSRLFPLRGKIWNGRKLVRWQVYLVYFNQWSVLKSWLIWKKGGLLLFLEPALFILVVTAYISKLVKGFAGFHHFTMSSHDEKSDSAFSAPFGGVEVDTTSSLILGATWDAWYFPKITPSGDNLYCAQLFELSMATAQLNLHFPCCWESYLGERPDVVARLRCVDAMFTTFMSKFPQKYLLLRDYQSAGEDVKVLLKPIVVLSSNKWGTLDVLLYFTVVYFCSRSQRRHSCKYVIKAFTPLILFLSQNDIFTISFALAILRTKRFVEEAANALCTFATPTPSL